MVRGFEMIVIDRSQRLINGNIFAHSAVKA